MDSVDAVDRTGVHFSALSTLSMMSMQPTLPAARFSHQRFLLFRLIVPLAKSQPLHRHSNQPAISPQQAHRPSGINKTAPGLENQTSFHQFPMARTRFFIDISGWTYQ
jgi:hypothetical protein